MSKPNNNGRWPDGDGRLPNNDGKVTSAKVTDHRIGGGTRAGGDEGFKVSPDWDV